MEDADFLETMDDEKIAFPKGDAIVADLEMFLTDKGQTLRPRYVIKKVHSFPTILVAGLCRIKHFTRGKQRIEN